jgi:flagellar basal-body rod protein FlgC
MRGSGRHSVASIPSFPLWPRPVRRLFGPLETSARGMGIQQRFLETIAQNIANAETTHVPGGGAYHRQIALADGGDTPAVADPTPGRLVYDPGHPDANADGFVEYPNVDVNTEIVDLMVARRVHEANVSVFQAAKGMLRRALDI